MEDHDHDQTTFNSSSDICHQLMHRYSSSSAPHHRHLIATAAAMRSLLSSESLPLSPPAYFAAAISSDPSDAHAAAALLAFLAIVLPLLPPDRGLEPHRASEAAAVMASLLEKKGLGAASVRAGVKCVGILVGFCDLEDWGSVQFGFQTLLNFAVDKRPKVRKCSQECLEKVFKLIKSSAVTKEASKLVMFMMEIYMPFAVELCNSGASAESTEEMPLEAKNVEVLHMLNLLKLVVPFLSMKTRSKVLSKVSRLLKHQFSTLTRHVLKIIETCFETLKADAITPVTESVMVSLYSYISLRDKNPSDTLISAATLLKRSLEILNAAELSLYAKNIPLVCESLAGLLTSEASVASHAATILKELINKVVDNGNLLLDDNQMSEVKGKESIESSAIKSICEVFKSSLMTSGGNPNEYILAVISALFLKLGGFSYYYMKDILIKLADTMNLAAGGKYNTCHLENCIGSAVIAVGPEKVLADLPITLNADDFSCSNIWLVPILKNYVIGASLEYYMQHILPLAKSFRESSRKVKRTKIGRTLRDRAHELCRLLPAFCQYPTDLHQNVGPLTEVLVKFLKKKDTSMHESVAVSIQVLVNQNKSAINQNTDAAEAKSFEVKGSLIECKNLPIYSKKIASKNMKALALSSATLLEALTNVFIDSSPAKRAYLKDAIRCLACITDSSIAEKILMSFFERFELIDDKGEFRGQENQEEFNDENQGNVNTMEKDSERCVILELASSLIGGAKDVLIDLVYNFIKYTFRVTNATGHQQAYHTLSRILEDHASFCSSQSIELIDLLLGIKSPMDADTLRSRFACFHPLLVHVMKINTEEGNEKAFLMVNEIILSSKDAKDEAARKEAYDVLLKISSSLRDVPYSGSDSSEAPQQKLISMIMAYLSGASPRIKCGAVSVLSALIYGDTSLCLSVPELVPTLLSLLQGRSLDVIKAALGFMKVLVSCLQARDLQNLLSSVVSGILPWSAVSRNHFRSKVTIIMEILIRKCGISAVESVTPDKYCAFVKSVVEGRQNKPNSKDASDGEAETKDSEKPTTRHDKRKRKTSDIEAKESGSFKHRRKMDGKRFPNSSGTNGAGKVRRNFGAKQFNKEKLTKDQSESIKPNRSKFDKGPSSDRKQKMSMGPKGGGVRKPSRTSTFGKRKNFGKK